ncbi:MAG: hypothetical protein SX243_17160 [Acidobacteriota bacterium]|nr:hypothetical protein [Acidobacteriota bacterium]
MSTKPSSQAPSSQSPAPTSSSTDSSPPDAQSSELQAPDLRVEEATEFALWLSLRGSVGDPWRAVIEGLAQELDGPVFAPHVTLWGGFRRSLAQAQKEVEVLTRDLAPIPLRGSGVGLADDFYRALFVPLATTPELWRARRAAGELLAPGASADYLPHLSLFYGSQPAALKLDALARQESLPALEAVADAVSLVSLDGPPESWKTYAMLPLRG